MEGCEHVAGGKGVRVLTCGCFQKPNSFSPHPQHTPRAQMDAAACGVRTFSPARTARARRAPPCGVRTFSPAFWSVPIHTGAADAWRFSLTSWAAVIHCMGQCAAPIAEGTAVEPEGARAGAVNRVKRKNATPPHARSSGGRSLLGHSGEEVQSAVPNAMVSGSIVCCGEEQGTAPASSVVVDGSFTSWSRAVRCSNRRGDGSGARRSPGRCGE